MNAQPQPELEGARWSSAVLCPRWAVYQHQHAPQTPPTDEQRLLWKRGHAVSNAIRSEKIAEFRAAGRRPRVEEEIPWPAAEPVGVGHADCYVPHERGIFEITSTAGCDLDPHKAVQTAGYVLEHPRAEQGVVVSVDPSTFQERVYPIDVEGLEPKVRQIQERVVEGCRSGELPDRVCRTPFDGPAGSGWCPFVEHCFDGWERPGVDELIGYEAEAEALADAKDRTAALRRDLKVAEEQQHEAAAKLRGVVPAKRLVSGDVVEEGERVVCGGFSLQRSVSVSERFSLTDARAAGHDVPRRLDPFVTISETERWTVKRIGGDE